MIVSVSCCCFLLCPTPVPICRVPQIPLNHYFSTVTPFYIARGGKVEKDPEGDDDDEEEVEEEEEQECIAYFWQGRDAGKMPWLTFSLGGTRQKVEALVKKKHGCDLRVRVERQQEESMPFMALFNRQLVIHHGHYSSHQEQRKPQDVTPHLFRVHQWRPSVFTRAVEERLDSRLLNPRDCYILQVPFEGEDNKGVLYVWLGAEADDSLQATALSLGKHKLWGANFPVQRVVQGNEPMNFFWRALNVDRPEAAFDPAVAAIANTRVFRCSTKSGVFTVQELSHSYCQADLLDESVVLVSGPKVFYEWIGPYASDVVKKLAHACAVEYVRRHQRQTFAGNSSDAGVQRVLKGKEPFEFTAVFHGWQQHLKVGRELAKPFEFLGHVTDPDYERQCYEPEATLGVHQVIDVQQYKVEIPARSSGGKVWRRPEAGLAQARQEEDEEEDEEEDDEGDEEEEGDEEDEGDAEEEAHAAPQTKDAVDGEGEDEEDEGDGEDSEDDGEDQDGDYNVEQGEDADDAEADDGAGDRRTASKIKLTGTDL